MGIVFAHDHKFREIDGRLYSPGGLPNEVFERYTKEFNKVTVIARVIKEDKQNPKYSEITNHDVVIMTRSSLKDAIEKADGVIARLPSVIGSLAIREAKRQHKPYLVEVVGCAWDAYWNYGVKGKIVAPFIFLMMRYQVRRAPFVIYVTNQFLQNRYPTNGESVACSNVNIGASPFDMLGSRINRIKQGRDTLIIGTTAAIDVPYKGQRFVVEALGNLSKKNTGKYIYQLVGGGDASMIKAIADQNGVDDQVQILGSMPHDKVLQWLDSIDIYIQPSLTEGLPRALIEAMSRGVACIGTDAGGTPELLNDKYIVKTKKSDLGKEFADRILEISDEEELIGQAKRNYEEANTNYLEADINRRRQEFFSKFKSTFSL